MPIDTFARSWRTSLDTFVRSTKRHLLLASPYIKTAEAHWISSRLRDSVDITVLTDIRAQSIMDESLDLEALSVLSAASANSQVITLSRLHAKVFIADTDMAIVTSANLTSSGLGSNYEYGVGIRNRVLVGKIRSDLEDYARLGSAVGTETLSSLLVTADELLRQGRKVRQSSSSALRKAFNARLRAANDQFIATQVGERSANDLFSEAIRVVLQEKPRSTSELQPEIQRLLPDLCDDSRELIINGERYGKAWKHRVRNAQQHLKRRREIAHDPLTRSWSLIQ